MVEDNDQQCLALLICFAEFSETAATWSQLAGFHPTFISFSHSKFTWNIYLN